MLTDTQGAAPVTSPSSTPAAGTSPTATEYGSFLGVEPESLPSLQSEHQPEPADAETESQETVEAGADETQEATPEELESADETQEFQEEDTDNWLPSEQEKEFPLEVLAKLAKRYDYTQEEVLSDPRIQNILKDKVNADIYVEQLRRDLEGQQEPEPQEVTEATPATPADPRAEYYARVDAIVSQLNQQSVADLGTGLLAAFGVNTDIAKLDQMLANSKLSPEQRAEVQGAKTLAQNAAKVGQTLTRGAADIIMTMMPQVLPQAMEAVAPGLLQAFRDAQEKTAYATAWRDVTTKTNAQGQPIYGKMPAYGTEQYYALARAADAKLGLEEGSLGSMVFKDANGKPLSLVDNMRKVYTTVAKLSTGQRIAPTDVARAVNAGRQQERTQQQRRAAGRALGAGQTSRAFEQQEDGDPMRDALRAEILRQNSQADPFAGARNVGS